MPADRKLSTAEALLKAMEILREADKERAAEVAREAATYKCADCADLERRLAEAEAKAQGWIEAHEQATGMNLLLRAQLAEQRALLRKALEALRYLAKESSIGVAAVRAEWGNALCKFCEEMDEYTSWDPTGMRRANASMEAFLAERGKGERREQ